MKTFFYTVLLLGIVSVVTNAQLLEQVAARELLPQVLTKARTDLGQNTTLRASIFAGINYQGIDLTMNPQTGKASAWVYLVDSSGSSPMKIYVALKTILGVQIQALPVGSLPTIPGMGQLTVLNDPWVDSPASLQAAMNAGGGAFFQSHNDAKVATAIVFYNPIAVPQPPIPQGPFWTYRFASGTDTLTCFVNGTTGVAIGCGTPTAVTIPDAEQTFLLEQNYPNPVGASSFSSLSTTIRFHVADIAYRKDRNARMTLRLYDALGREVKSLLHDEAFPGSYSVPVDFRDLPAGNYFYKLSIGTQTQTKRLLVVK